MLRPSKTQLCFTQEPLVASKNTSISPTGVTWSQPGDEIENRESKIGICFWLPRGLKLTYPGKLGPSKTLLFLAREPLGTSKTPLVLVWEPLGASQVPKIKNQKSISLGKLRPRVDLSG